MLLVSSGERPNTLNTLQCTRETPTTKKDLVQDVSNAKVEKPCPREKPCDLSFLQAVYPYPSPTPD